MNKVKLHIFPQPLFLTMSFVGHQLTYLKTFNVFFIENLLEDGNSNDALRTAVLPFNFR